MDLRRLVPDGLAARFALLLVCALMAVNLVALGLLALERSRHDREAREARTFEQIVSLVPAMEAVDPVVGSDLARDATGRFLRLTLRPKALVAATGADPRSRALARALSEALPGREVRVLWLDRRRRADPLPETGRDGGPDARPDGFPDGPPNGVALSIRLEGRYATGAPVWLNARSRHGPPLPPTPQNRSFFVVPFLSLAVVLGVGLVFVRRLTRPLARLAAATRAAGQGDRKVRVPEEGARELRAAAAAFNDMQARIAAFDAERMRTLAAVGHDLRTPITSLRIRAEMLDEAEAAPMIRTLDEMTVMANGLIAYAKGAAQTEPLETLDLAAFLGRLCGELGATLRIEAGAEVEARPVALGRALGNLIDNAIRYGGDARVALRRAGAEALVVIEDQGPGIPPERLEAMFEPFVRGEESRSAETGGAGLGLSIARNIVLAHGGRITVENAPEGGLRARVRLPLASGGSVNAEGKS
jgi:signal transduction histidine kinase